MGCLEDADGFEGSVLARGRSGQDSFERRGARTSRGPAGVPLLRPVAPFVLPRSRPPGTGACCRAVRLLRRAGGSCPVRHRRSPARRSSRDAPGRSPPPGPGSRAPRRGRRISRPSGQPTPARSSSVPVEPARAQEQPGEASSQAAVAIGRIDRRRVELLDDRAEARRERVGRPPGEVELLARALGRQGAIPVPRRAARRPTSRAGSATPSACRRTALPCPAIAIGTIGAPVRRAISAQPTRNGPSRPAGPLTVPSGIWAKTPPFAVDRPRRRRRAARSRSRRARPAAARRSGGSATPASAR